MSKAKKTLLLAGASAFAILASVAGVNAETPGRYDFLVPVSGKYEVLAFGASGGSIQDPGAIGGLGAGVGGELFLTAGQHLTLFVGGMGADGVSMDGARYGGGGGSFIFLGAGTTDLLVAAGGGVALDFLATAVRDWPDQGAVTALACQARLAGQAA
jgi:Glycine rich protein